MILNILIIIGGIIAVLVGFIGFVLTFTCLDVLEQLWAIPLMLIGIFMIYTAGNSIIETSVNERLQQYQIENVVEKVEEK